MKTLIYYVLPALGFASVCFAGAWWMFQNAVRTRRLNKASKTVDAALTGDRVAVARLVEQLADSRSLLRELVEQARASSYLDIEVGDLNERVEEFLNGSNDPRLERLTREIQAQGQLPKAQGGH